MDEAVLTSKQPRQDIDPSIFIIYKSQTWCCTTRQEVILGKQIRSCH